MVTAASAPTAETAGTRLGERLCWCQRVTSRPFAAAPAPDSKRFEPLAELLSVPLDVWSPTGVEGTIV